MPTTTGLATSFITFSRPGASGGGATVTDRDGRIKWAGHNLLTNSESFDAWSKYIVTVSANATAAPNGTTTADRVVEASGTSLHSINSNSVTLASNSAYTYAVFAKADQRSWIGLNAYAGADYYTYFNLSNGTIGTNASGNTATITSVGNGWYLCTVTRSISSSVAGILAIDLATADGTNSYNGNTSNGIHLWGAHLYRSDLGGMQLNPSMPAGMQSYYPTTPRNALGWTEDFSNAAWTKVGLLAFGSGSTANATVAPNGLQTADLIVQNTSNSGHYLEQYITATASPYVGSVYLKYYNCRWVRIGEVGSGGVYFDLLNGAKGNETSGSTGTITPAGNGWYRCSIAYTSAGGYPKGIFVAMAQSNGGPLIFTGDGTSGIYLWGAQLSDSASLDTYVPQYGAAVTSAAYYAPRLDFDGATLSPKGLLVEEQRTNVLTRTAEFDHAVWERVDITSVTADAVIAPDGTQTADTIVFSANNGSRIFQGSSQSPSNGQTATFSVWMKGSGTISINTDTYSSSGGTEVAVTLSSTWTRYTVSHTYVSPSGVFRVMIVKRSGQTATSVDVWGAQLEVGAFATSYIPNSAVSAGVTRAADVASVSTGAFPYSSSEGTIVASVDQLSASIGSYAATISDGTNNNEIRLTTGGGNRYAEVILGGSSQAGFTFSAAYTPNAVRKNAIAYKANDFGAAENGTNATPDTSGSIPTVSSMYLGIRGDNASSLNGHIRQITYIPRRLTAAELAARSA